jgi:hypothetical protein
MKGNFLIWGGLLFLFGQFTGYCWGRDTAPTYATEYKQTLTDYNHSLKLLIEANKKIKLANKLLNDTNIIIINNYQ